ncbi:MAG: hypothetical protein R3316_01820 [Rhodovibrionaceae bacterium]|nr:hypothetical protein [Rhodovibrionaceae bacterium]
MAAFFLAAAVVTGYFSNQPAHRNFPADKAQIKLSFSHGAERVEECRRLSSEEIAELPASERRPNTCARERVPLRVQMRMDGEVLYDEEIEPSGLSADGPAQVYREFTVPTGNHSLELRLRDSRGQTGFDYNSTFEVQLSPRRNLAIDFRDDAGGFILR